MKMVENSLLDITKNRNSLQKRARESYQNLSDEEKEKNSNMVANDIKTFLNIKIKGWLTVEKIIIKFGKIKTN